MPEGLADFNANNNLQSITADSPEQLAAILRQIKVLCHVVGFVADQGKHTAYVRCHHKITVNRDLITVGGPIRSGQS